MVERTNVAVKAVGASGVVIDTGGAYKLTLVTGRGKAVETVVLVQASEEPGIDQLIISVEDRRALGWDLFSKEDVERLIAESASLGQDIAAQITHKRKVDEMSAAEFGRIEREVIAVGMEPEAEDKCLRVLRRNVSIFRTDMTAGDYFTGVQRYGSQAIAEDLLKPTRPHNDPPRNSPKHAVMESLLNMFLMLGVLVRATFMSRYAYPVFLVGFPEKPRMVANTSMAAANVVKEQATVLRLEDEMRKQEGHVLFFVADIVKAFYMCRVALDAPEKVRMIQYAGQQYMFTRLIMGEVNSAEFLVRTMTEIFGHLSFLSGWMDDQLGGGRTDIEFVENLERWLDACSKHNVLVHAAKFHITRKAYWCGHFISKEGIDADTFSKELIWSLPVPVTGEDLAKLIGCVQFFQKFIPDGARLMEPIRKVMEAIYKAADGSRKNSSVRKFKVKSFGWTEVTTAAWDRVKAILANTDTLRVRNPKQALVLYTDASSEGWGGIAVQCPFEDLGLRPTDARNQLLSCCGGRFDDTQRRYPTVELEAFAVKESIDKMWHILGDGSTIHVFTDNEVLSQILMGKGEYVARKDRPGQNRMMRWMEIFFSVPLVVKHIAGELNTFADVVSRLERYPKAAQSPKDDEVDSLSTPILARVTAVHLRHSLRTVMDEDWVQPAVTRLRSVIGQDGKQNADVLRWVGSLKNAVFDYAERVWKVGDAVAIPDILDMRIELIVMAHAYGAGHRGAETTSRLLEAVVYWPGIKDDVKKFVAGCIHCLEKTSSLLNVPWGTPIAPKGRNEVVSFDFLDLGMSEQGFSKLLVITDKLSGFTMLHKTVSESATVASLGLMAWLSKFGKPRIFLSDGGVAFKNEVVAALREKMKIDHHFVTAYSHWANGKQERLNLTIGNIFRTILSENSLPETQWCFLVEMAEMIVNHTPVKSLKWMAPVSIMVGLEPINPLDAFLDPRIGDWKQVRLNESELERYVADFRLEISKREAVVHEFQEQEAAGRRKKQGAEPGVKHLQVDRGDFVMVLEAAKKTHVGKLAKRWIGPARVLEFDREKPHSVKIEYLCPVSTRRKIEVVHTTRVRYFDNSKMVISPELLAHAESIASKRYVISGFQDLRKGRGGFEILVQWEGYEGEDSWEPLARMSQDVPTLVWEFLKNGVPEASKSLLDEVRKLAYYRKLASREGGSVSV